MRTIRWGSGAITTIDKTLLPVEYMAIECKTVYTLCEAIVSLRIRGAPADAAVYNPAFDATPVENVTAVITEDGVVYPDESESWNDLFS